MRTYQCEEAWHKTPAPSSLNSLHLAKSKGVIAELPAWTNTEGWLQVSKVKETVESSSSIFNYF